MPAAYIIADRSIENAVDRRSFGRVTVGANYKLQGVRDGEAVTLYVEIMAGNQLYYPAVRLYLEPSQAHQLAEQLETLAKSIKFGYEPKPQTTK